MHVVAVCCLSMSPILWLEMHTMVQHPCVTHMLASQVGGYRVTDKDALKISVEAAGQVRTMCEQYLSKVCGGPQRELQHHELQHRMFAGLHGHRPASLACSRAYMLCPMTVLG